MLKVFHDQMNNKVEISYPLKRIISIVPSQTELLYSLGLDKEVVGITKFCVHPEKWYQTKTSVGGTKKLNLKKIIELNPDLIIGNKEENEQLQINELMNHFPVWMSDIYTLNDAYEMILKIGEITNKEKEAIPLIGSIKNSFQNFKTEHKPEPYKVAYFIWRNPYMAIGRNTFINHMLENVCGFENIFKDFDRYPEIDEQTLKETNPDLVFLSSEPYPFKNIHIDEIRKILPQSKVLLIDGEMFSWYGSRLLLTADYFRNLLLQLR